MRGALILLSIVMAGSAINSAHADPYRWCAVYRTSSSSCYFLTLDQCLATVSGLGGFCNPSSFYDGRPMSAPGEFVGRSKSLGKSRGGLVGKRGKR